MPVILLILILVNVINRLIIMWKHPSGILMYYLQRNNIQREKFKILSF